MKVLQIVTDLRISNGIMSVVLNYAKAMPKGITFDVLYFRDFKENRKADIEDLGGKVYQIKQPGIKSFGHCDIDDFLNGHKGEYQAVHIHAPHLAIMLVPKLRKYGFNRIAVSCHSVWYSLFPKNRLRNHILSIPVKYMNVQRLACGKMAGEFWYGKGNFKVLPNAINCECFRYDEIKRIKKREELGYTDKFVVGHVGRVKPVQKNHPFLIEIFAEICKINSESRLVLIGANKEPELVSLAQKLGVEDKIDFVGQRTDVNQLLASMDVFIFPSFYEGLPVSVVEAQAAGLPVVMSNSVTDEVCCTDKIIRISLEKSAKEWAETAMEYAKKGVGDTFDQMIKSGWDINASGQKLAEFYGTGVFKNDRCS